MRTLLDTASESNVSLYFLSLMVEGVGLELYGVVEFFFLCCGGFGVFFTYGIVELLGL